MLLFVVLSNLVCLLLPVLTSAHVTTPDDSVNLAAHHVKRLSTPLKNLLRKRDAILLASAAGASNALALNSTNGKVVETIPFEVEVDIPGQGRLVYFLVKGEIDDEDSVTIEFWVHYLYDRRIGVFYGNTRNGIDMKIPESIKVTSGEARLFVVVSGGYDILMIEAYGSVNVPSSPATRFPDFTQPIKRWKTGDLASIEDVPNNSGVRAVSNGAGVITT